MKLDFIKSKGAFAVVLQGNLGHLVEISNSATGNLTRLDNELNSFAEYLENNKVKLEEAKNQLETAKQEVEKPFPRLEEMRGMERRLNELNRELSIDNNQEAEHTAEKDEPDIEENDIDENNIDEEELDNEENDIDEDELDEDEYEYRRSGDAR